MTRVVSKSTNKYRIKQAVPYMGVLIIGIALGLFASQSVLLPGVGVSSRTLDLDSVQRTYAKLQQNYDGKLDNAKLIEGANRGMVAAAGDQYTLYFDHKEAQEFDNDLEGSFEGIGAELDKKEGKLVVVSPLAGSPAEKSGIKAQDIIIRVDGSDTADWSIDKAITRIRGKSGTKVALTVLRDGELKDISVTRAKIESPSVKQEIKNGVGVITISRFGKDTTTRARKAAHDLREAGVQKVVLDLRGNGGGYLDAAQGVASLWLKEGAFIVQERKGNKVEQTITATGDAVLQGIPTVVLIDKGSASASEIVAGALHDNGVAQLVGEKSFGKGSVQTVLDLDSGAKLKVTIAKWYTPKGKNISKQGITPDVTVLYGDSTPENDAQLNKALALLQPL